MMAQRRLNKAGTLKARLNTSMLHLDYVSCLLTVASTVMVGKRLWQGWIVAALNSMVICVIGIHTGQWGFVPANIFCLLIYIYNLHNWRQPQLAPAATQSPTQAVSVTLDTQAPPMPRKVLEFHKPRRPVTRVKSKSPADESITGNRIRPRTVPDRRESTPTF
jgi:hypothetical protein